MTIATKCQTNKDVMNVFTIRKHDIAFWKKMSFLKMSDIMDEISLVNVSINLHDLSWHGCYSPGMIKAVHVFDQIADIFLYALSTKTHGLHRCHFRHTCTCSSCGILRHPYMSVAIQQGNHRHLPTWKIPWCLTDTTNWSRIWDQIFSSMNNHPAFSLESGFL